MEGFANFSTALYELIRKTMSKPEYVLRVSTRDNKKYMITLVNGRKTVHFGQRNAEDYTIHRDVERRQRYIARHRSRENWNKSGIDTAGFWAKNLLWNKPTISASIRDIERRFKVKIHNRL